MVVARLDPKGRMELVRASDPAGRGAAVDFQSIALRGVSKLALVRACTGGGRVIDATAGLGGDSWLLAAAGCSVRAIERSTLVAEVLLDGLDRALRTPSLARIASRIEVAQGDARELLAAGVEEDTAIYLDPMYPIKKSSALAPKSMRLVRELVGDDIDSAELFLTAVRACPRRIVVKRPHHAPCIHPDPDLVAQSKLARYDIYLRHGQSLKQLLGAPRR